MQQPVPFGKYILLERISVGGMAEVFKAKSFGVKGFAKIIAIKKILPQLAQDSSFVEMFVDEAKTAVQLAHANICQIFDLGREGSDHFIAMEYISGKDLLSLHNYFRRTRSRMPVPLVMYIAARICEGLDYAHRRRGPDGEPLGIVHRDVSPQNVIVSYDGGVKVIDFGIAKARLRTFKETQAGILKGKFGYMSPEQIEGKSELDHRSDIFAIGTVVHELLTGKRLFLGDSDFATLEMVRNADVSPASDTNPEVPPELDAILFRALARNPDERYPFASEMADDLSALSHAWEAGERPISAQAMGEWMETNFAADIAKEKARHEVYAQIDGLSSPDESTEVEATRVDDPLGAALGPPTVSGQGDEEEETALWEPLEELAAPPKAVPPKAVPPKPVPPKPVPPKPTPSRPSTSKPAQPQARHQRPTEDALPAVARARSVVQEVPSVSTPLERSPLDRGTMPGLPGLADRVSHGTTTRDLIIALVLVVLAGAGGVLAYRALDGPVDDAPTAGLVVRVDPSDDVTIYLDNQVVSTRSPYADKNLSTGAHALRVEHGGFEPWVGQVVLIAGQVVETQVNLAAQSSVPARMLFVVSPPDARVTVDSRSIGAAELSNYVNVPSGRPVVVEATRDGFQPYKETFRADAGVSRTHNIVLVPTLGSLFIDSDPPGEITLNGKIRGRTPQSLHELDITREYVVRIERPGYKIHEERVRFGEKRDIQVEPKLAPLKR